MTLSDGPITFTKGDHSRSIWIRIWDNNNTGKLLIEGRVSPANGKVIFGYLTAGSTNEGGTKNHRFNQTVTKEASIRELLQQNTLLSWDVLLFALIALQGISDLGVESHGGRPRGKHLVKLHIGYTELNPGHWHHFHRTHLPCAWHEEGVCLVEIWSTCTRQRERANDPRLGRLGLASGLALGVSGSVAVREWFGTRASPAR